MLREISMDGAIWVGRVREQGRAKWVGWERGGQYDVKRGGWDNPVVLKFHAFCSNFWREFVIYPVIFHTFYVAYSRAYFFSTEKGTKMDKAKFMKFSMLSFGGPIMDIGHFSIDFKR